MMLVPVNRASGTCGAVPRCFFSASMAVAQRGPARNVECLGRLASAEEKMVVSPLALSFVAGLQREFDARRLELLRERTTAPKLAFDPQTATIRDNADWRVASLPADLKQRKVEITGPANSKKMVINALNSGASCYMADFEDSLAPSWANVVASQVNLREAVRGTIEVHQGGKEYKVNADSQTVLHMRPRGLHLEEKHVQVDGAAVGGAWFDFGLYAFHNARALAEKGSGTYVYIPKLESVEEARLWRDVFVATQHTLGLEKPIKCSVLIETLPAAFVMEEILHELRNHAAALNCGRWDYIFSHVKHQAANPALGKLPDRADLGMDQPFLQAYSKELVRACHTRGALAMGGMAAQVPVREDGAASKAAAETANKAARNTVLEDKEREVINGHDGTWVAHPALVEVAREAFAGHIGSRPNQRNFGVNDRATTPEANRLREAVLLTALTTLPEGHLTLEGVETNVEVFLRYMDAWLGGNGCVALNGRMEDAATAEISRAQRVLIA